MISGYGFARGEAGAKKALARVAAGTDIAVLAVNVLSWLWVFRALPSGFDTFLQHAIVRRKFYDRQHPEAAHKSGLQEPAQASDLSGRGTHAVLFVCVGAVGAFNLFNSILAGLAVFIGALHLGTG